MEIKVLGCCGGQLPGKNNSGYLLDGKLLIDAGTVALTATIKEQRGIRNILISHSHLDHIGALPFYAVNIVSNKADTVTIAGSEFTISAIKNHLLNNVVWPDFSKIKNVAGNEIFGYKTIEAGRWYDIGGYKVKAVPVNHPIPTFGFIIGKGEHYIIYSGDTKTTDAIWAEAKALGKKLKTVFVEISFPDEMQTLAENSFHYVPKTLVEDLRKMGGLKPKIYAYHIKPEYLPQVKKQLKKITEFDIVPVVEKKTYTV
jgi:ribonuclease BN (tRNA processing enzyme)